MTLDNVPMPILKMIFGYMLLVLLAILATIIALGKVSQDTSFGLSEILGGLLVLSGGFAHWAFGEPARSPQSESSQPPRA